MGNQESHPTFFTRFLQNLFVTMLWFLGLTLVLMLFRVITPVHLRLLLPATLLGVLLWSLQDPRPARGRRVQALLRKRKYEQAFSLARPSGRLDTVKEFLENELKLPSEALRPAILATFAELRTLCLSVEDPTNRFVDTDLRKSMRSRSQEARQALWKLCENLEVVATQQVRFTDDHPKMKRIALLLEELAQSTGRVRVKLAELTLAPQDAELEEARIAIDQVRRQSEALLEWEAILDESV